MDLFSGMGSLHLWEKVMEAAPFVLRLNAYPLAVFFYLATNLIGFISINRLFFTIINQKHKTITVMKFGLIFVLVSLCCHYGAWHLDSIFFAVYPPYYVLIIYFLYLYGLKIRKDKCLAHLFMLYCAFVNTRLVYCLGEVLGLYILTDERQYAAVISITASAVSCFAVLVFCGFARKSASRVKLCIEQDFQYKTTGKSSILTQLLKAALYYGAVIFILSFAGYCGNIYTAVANLSGVIMLYLAYFFLRYYRERIEINTISMQNINLHINSLVSSIDNFRFVKHDINNIMQVYDGYMKLKDYDALKKYHDKVYRTTKLAGDNLSITKKMYENPALYAVLIAKINSAEERGIYVSVSCTADASLICADPMSLSRLIGFLLDNAIEATIRADQQTIHFSLEQVGRDKILVSSSNPADSNIDIEPALSELVRMTAQMPKVALSVEHNENMITVYLELPCWEK